VGSRNSVFSLGVPDSPTRRVNFFSGGSIERKQPAAIDNELDNLGYSEYHNDQVVAQHVQHWTGGFNGNF